MSLSDWVHSPWLEPADIGLGIFIIAAIAVMGLLATWVVVAPGAVTDMERLRAGRVAGMRGRLEVLLVRAAPLLVVFAVAATLFPVEPACCLVLSSRACSALAAPPKQRWNEWLGQNPQPTDAPGGLWDAGPVVDAIIVAVETDFADVIWRKDDEDLLARVRARVRDLLGAGEVEPRSVDSLHAISHHTVTTLPAWLLESLEPAVLKGLMQRHHTKRVIVFRDDRETIVGRAWDGVASYMRGDAGRFVAPEVVLLPPESLGAEASVALVRVLTPLRRAPEGTCRLGVRLRIAAAPPNSPKVRFSAELLTDAGGQELTWEISPGTVAEFRDVFLQVPSAREGQPGSLRQVVDGERLAPFPVPAAASDYLTGWSGRVWVRGDDAAALVDAEHALASEPSFSDWRGRMADRGTPLNPISFAAGDHTDAKSGDVLFDTEVEPGGLWIYPQAATTPCPHVSAPLQLDGLVEARAALATRPGLDSVARLRLFPPMLGITTGSREDLAFARPLRERLQDGTRLRKAAKETRWAARFALPATDGREVTGTFVGVEARRLAGRSTPVPTVEERQALWALVLESVYVAAGSALAERPPDETDQSHPVVLLRAADIRLLRGRGLTKALTLLLAGTSLYAAIVLLGVYRAREALSSRRNPR